MSTRFTPNSDQEQGRTAEVTVMFWDGYKLLVYTDARIGEIETLPTS